MHCMIAASREMSDEPKKMCAKIRKEGMDWLIKLFYDPTDTLFRHLRHINQRNLQNIVA